MRRRRVGTGQQPPPTGLATTKSRPRSRSDNSVPDRCHHWSPTPLSGSPPSPTLFRVVAGRRGGRGPGAGRCRDRCGVELSRCKPPAAAAFRVRAGDEPAHEGRSPGPGLSHRCQATRGAAVAFRAYQMATTEQVHAATSSARWTGYPKSTTPSAAEKPSSPMRSCNRPGTPARGVAQALPRLPPLLFALADTGPAGIETRIDALQAASSLDGGGRVRGSV